MDFIFVHNPAGPFAIALQHLLEPNGLHIILKRFAQMIQSGRNIYLDNNTRLTIWSYSPIQGGALQPLHNTNDIMCGPHQGTSSLYYPIPHFKWTRKLPVSSVIRASSVDLECDARAPTST